MSQAAYVVMAWAGVLAAAPAPEGEPKGEMVFRIRVDPGAVPRRHSPVSVRLEVGKDLTAEAARRLAEGRTARVDDGERGAAVCLAQAEPERPEKGRPAAVLFHWVEPALEAGKTRVRKVVAGGLNADVRGDFRVVEGEGFRELHDGAVPLWRHMIAFDPARREETYKPYHHLFGFRKDLLITKGPGGKYPHHRGVFLAWNKTRLAEKSFDFWHCTQGAAQRHAGYLPERQALGPVLGRTASVTEWVDGEGKVIGRDVREVTAWRQPERQMLLDFEVTVEAVAGDLRLEGDPQHAGLQFRAAQEVAEREKETVYLLPGGAARRPNDVVESCRWAACLFKVEGQPFAVAHMDHPGNPASVYSTRLYGRFGSYFPADLKKGAPLRLRYRLLVRDPSRHPDSTQAGFEERYRDFAEPIRAEVLGAGS